MASGETTTEPGPAGPGASTSPGAARGAPAVGRRPVTGEAGGADTPAELVAGHDAEPADAATAAGQAADHAAGQAAGQAADHAAVGAVGEGAGPFGVVDRTATVVGRTPSPFTPRQLARIDEALTMSSRESGVEFSIYVGHLDVPTREHAEHLHSLLGLGAPRSVLLAVSPGQRVVHIVTGEVSARRLADRSCALAVLSMEASFSGGDLVGGIVNGLRMLSDQAGRRGGAGR